MPLPKKKTPNAKSEIDRLYEKLAIATPGSDTYNDLLKAIERHHAMKAEDSPKRVSRDAVLTGALQFLTVIAVVAYEQKHVWTTKAIGIFGKK